MDEWVREKFGAYQKYGKSHVRRLGGSSGSSEFFKLSVNPDVDDNRENKQNQVKNYFVNNPNIEWILRSILYL